MRTRDEIAADVQANYHPIFLYTFDRCGGDEAEREIIAEEWERTRQLIRRTSMRYDRIPLYPGTTVIDATRRRPPWYTRLSLADFAVLAVFLGVAAVCLGVPIYLALR